MSKAIMGKREYDFSKGIRCKHADRYREGTNLTTDTTNREPKSNADVDRLNPP
jgi:hypothetical protein